MNILRRFNKSKYLRVVKYYTNKRSEIMYYKDKDLPKDYIVNPDHIFLYSGYRTFMITDKSAESINPLDFKSKYPIEKYKTAINSKLINDTFNNLKQDNIDWQKIALFGSLMINIIILFMMMKMNGVF